jgi:hypothetical protein
MFFRHLACDGAVVWGVTGDFVQRALQRWLLRGKRPGKNVDDLRKITCRQRMPVYGINEVSLYVACTQHGAKT